MFYITEKGTTGRKAKSHVPWESEGDKERGKESACVVAKVNRETPDLVLHGGSLFDSEGRSPRVIEAFRDLNIYRTEDLKKRGDTARRV